MTRAWMGLMVLGLVIGLSGCATGDKSPSGRVEKTTCAMCNKEARCEMCMKCDKCRMIVTADEMQCKCMKCSKEFACAKCKMMCPGCDTVMMSGTKVIEASAGDTRHCKKCDKTIAVADMYCACDCGHRMTRADMMNCKCGGMMTSAGMCCADCRVAQK